MKPWIIYTRVSTDEQAKEGVSLEAQRKSCEAMLTAQRIDEFEIVVDDGYSGKSLRRPGLNEVLRRCERGDVAGLCVYALDRLTRSRKDIHAIVESLEKGNAALVGVRDKIDTTGPSGRFMLHMLANLANLEIEQTAERVRHAFREIRSKGGCTHQAPAGCILVRGEDRIPRLHAHPQHGQVIASTWDMLNHGRVLSDVATYLDGKVPTRNGKPWTKAAVHYLASNRTYIGILVDQKTFDGAQGKLQRRRHALRRDTTAPAVVDRPQTALAGLCYCEICGSAMVQVANHRDTGDYVYLRCSGRLKRGVTFCAASDIPAKPVEDIVFASLRRWMDDGTIANQLSAWIAKRCQSVADALAKAPDLRRQRDAIQKKADLIMELVEEGGPMPPKLAIQRLQDFQRQIDAINAELEGLTTAESMVSQHREVADQMIDHLKRAMTRIEQANVDDRQTILHGIIRKITLNRNTGASVELASVGVPTEVSNPYNCQEWLPRLDSNQE